MYCQSCGAEIPEGSESCPGCGTKLENTTSELAPARPKLKWLPIGVAGIAGVALSFVTTFALAGSLSTWAAFGILIASYIIAGLIAGVWAGIRGAGHGIWAGIVVVAIFTVLTLALGTSEVSITSVLTSALLNLVLAILLGALGGALGARIRPAKA